MREPAPPIPDASTESAPVISRRRLLGGAATAVAATALASLPVSGVAVPSAPTTQPNDPTKVQGSGPSPRGSRAPAEQPMREAGGAVSRTPLQELHGTITPADLHFERHHAGVPNILPSEYRLTIHGLVERPTVFTLEDLKRLPSVSRILFLECAGNLRRNAPPETTPQTLCGLTSQSEWTGVLVSTLFREVGADPAATWFLAEGQDAAVMTRSIPVEKGWSDAMIAYAQNGEAIRPEQGYPARLLCPGWEGNTSVKWIRRLELATQPFMTREETSKYTEARPDGTARQFSFVMDARSVITSPAYPHHLPEPGWIEVRGIAWSGRGRISTVDVSFDEGQSWVRADLQGPVLPLAHTRFRILWKWDGSEATILSRATDETGNVQPDQRSLIAERGLGGGPYHLNPITGWRVLPDGEVLFRTEPWA